MHGLRRQGRRHAFDVSPVRPSRKTSAEGRNVSFTGQSDLSTGAERNLRTSYFADDSQQTFQEPASQTTAAQAAGAEQAVEPSELGVISPTGPRASCCKCHSAIDRDVTTVKEILRTNEEIVHGVPFAQRLPRTLEGLTRRVDGTGVVPIASASVVSEPR
jgi:hypothetical protein